ncbi:MAG: Aminopeptidase N [Firmicutes bacterium ADurb.Bin248]|nr:MAG: Aminopeptidase N [Firmicutes bacterium ADurb.Bin248]
MAKDTSVYVSPLVERFATAEMARLWSADRKFSTWRRCWVALAEAERELGLNVTEEQIAEMRAHLDDIDYAAAEAYERKTRHDVMAHIHAFGDVAPLARPIIHLGATSCYVGDNTDLILIREGLDLLLAKAAAVLAKLRDFALALMKEPYVETRQSAAGTAVTAFGTSKKRAVYSADAAVAALDYFSRNIGTYPYDTFFVVPFDMGGGMEYPGLVMLCERDLHGDDLSGAALVIGHEAAHQWFYSVVGSDQINAPWLDESLVEFLGFDFLRAYLGDEAAFARREARYGSLEGYKRTKRIDSALYDFAGSEYFLIVYASGCAMYDELYRELGRDAFFEALATYFNANSFSIADRDDLVAAFSEAAGGDMARWFEQRLAVPS